MTMGRFRFRLYRNGCLTKFGNSQLGECFAFCYIFEAMVQQVCAFELCEINLRR